MQEDGPGRGASQVAPWVTLLLALAWILDPSFVWAQAGCSGTAIQVSTLDNLLRTAWEYLTSGAVTRILAFSFIIAGVVGIISRRPVVAVSGFAAGAVAVFIPSILDVLIKQNQAGALAICG